MKKIYVAFTGGTMCSTTRQKEGKSPFYSPAEVIERAGVERIADIKYDIPIRDQWGRPVYIDSTNMQPEYQGQLARRFMQEYQNGIDGVVVGHGTDTGEFTAAALTFPLLYKKIPVVITGSMRSPDQRGSDAGRNLRDAILFASYGIPGTYIVFHGRVISGARAKKLHPAYVDAFRSINYPQIGRMVDGTFKPHEDAMEAVKRYEQRFAQRDMELMDGYENRTFLLDLFPGLNPSVVNQFFGDGYAGIIIEAFGTGGIPNNPHWRDLTRAIERWAPRKLVGITSKAFAGQTTTEYEVNTAAYRAGALPLHDMLPHTALAKANWLFGQVGTRRMGDIKKLMLFPFELEIGEEKIPKEDRLDVKEMERLLYDGSG